MITKKISLKEVVHVALFFIILLLQFSCGNKNDSTARTSADSLTETGDGLDTSKENQQVYMRDDSMVVSTPVYVGSSRFQQSFIEKFTKKNGVGPRRYERDSMIAMTVPYVKRVRKGGQGSPPPPPPRRPKFEESVNIKEERMLVYLDKPTLELLLDDNSDATGLIAIFATQNDSLNNHNPKNQTFILVPFNIDSMRAVRTKGEKPVGVIGYERWPAYVGMETLQNGNVKTNVESAYTLLGIN